MPFVHIRVAGPAPLSPEQVQFLQDGATHLMASVMRKKAELTAVLIEQVPARAWSVGASPVPVAAHLDVKITRGTNTAEEKERFIASAAGLLREVLGEDLPEATYVVVDEVAAEAWGYGGVTQDRRRRHRAGAADRAA